MKRLLKKTFQQYFSATAFDHSRGRCLRASRRLLLGASAVTASTLGLLGLPRVAHAFFLYEVDLSQYTPNSFTENIPIQGTTSSIRFQWTGATNRFTVLEPAAPGTLTGGFTGGSTLNVQFDPINPQESVTLNIDFLNNGTPAPIENIRLIVLDIDRDNANGWQDEVFLGGDSGSLTITPATDASPVLEVAPETVFTTPIAVEDVDRGGPGLANPADYTVADEGNDFIGIYAPPGPANLQDGTAVNVAGTTTEFDPNAGGNPVTVQNPLPEELEGNNQTPEGTITADYGSTAGQPVNNISLTYANGPVSLTPQTNPAGTGGFLTDANDNGGPANHGIGLYTVFFTPGVIGTGKSVSEPTPGPNDTFDVTYTIRVENFGEATELTDVQVTDDLTETFDSDTGFTVSNVQAAGGVNLTVNTDFNGDSDQNLLTGTESLAPGAFTLIQYDVNIDPAVVGSGQFDNTAVATANTPIGLPIEDRSTDDTDPGADGPNPDPNGDGDPLEDTPTPLTLPEVETEPQIGVAERVVSSEIEPTGTFGADTARVTYEIRVENVGPEDLETVSLTNDFIETFGPGANFQIISTTQTGGDGNVPVNDNYDGGDTGNNDTTLASGGTLEVGQFNTYEIVVDVDIASGTLPDPLPGPYINQTRADGIGVTSTLPTTDLSNDLNSVPGAADLAEAVDPNENGNAGDANPDDPALDEDTPTPVTLSTAPAIGVSEQVVSSTSAPDGAFGSDTVRVVYEIVVENIGPEDLNDVQLTNSLEDTFGDGSYQLVGQPQFIDGNPNLDAVNPGYDGDNQGDLNLLNPGQPGRTLPVGDSSTFQITVDVNQASATLPEPLPGPYINQTEAIGFGAQSELETTDLSNDVNSVPAGQDPIDPNGNNLANEPDENTPTPVSLGSDIQLTKRITQVLRNGQPLFVPQINQFNDQASDDSDNQLQTLSDGALPLGLFEAPEILRSGDIVEYTVYFFNAGTTSAQNLGLCDVLRVPNVLQTDTLELALPSTVPPTDGNFAANSLIEAREPLAPLEPSCEDVVGTGNFPPGPTDQVIPDAGGGVVVGESGDGAPSGLDLDANEIGAFRFQVVIP